MEDKNMCLKALIEPLSPFASKQTQVRQAEQTSSRRLFIKQYGAVALIIMAVLVAMMLPSRAQAQEDSTDDRPRIIHRNDLIPRFDIDTRAEGFIDNVDDDLKLEIDETYATADGTVYTCTDSDGCLIEPNGNVWLGEFYITYPDD